MMTDKLSAEYPKVALVAPTPALLGQLNGLLQGTDWQTELYFEGSRAAQVLGSRRPDVIVWVRSGEQPQTTRQFIQGLSSNPQLTAIPMLTISSTNLIAFSCPPGGWSDGQTPLAQALSALLPGER